MLTGVSIVIFVPVSYIIFGDIHEGGHALACMARGGHVGGFGGWMHGILPFANPPGTHCSIKPKTDSSSDLGCRSTGRIVNWFANAFIVTVLLNGVIIKPALLWRVFWSCGSFRFPMELSNEVRHACAPC